MGKLVIDLGHGGHDPGAIGPNKTHEADVVLAIGKELNELLKGYELEVKFTRLSNVYLSLSERAKIANDFKADYFLSIHINSATDNSVRGVEVWQYSNKNDKLNKFSKDLCEDVANIVCKIKKIQPATAKQIKYLKDLMAYHGIEEQIEYDKLSKNEASKKIDKIISKKGRIFGFENK